MKIKSKSAIKKQLDLLWSKLIHQKQYCEVCGKIGQNSHHVISRNNYTLRWDLKNGANLCVSCHIFGRNSAHSNPIFFLEWFKETRPEDYDYIKSKSEIIAHYTVLDLQEIYQRLKKELSEIQNQ